MIIEFDIKNRRECFKQRYYCDEECGDCYRLQKCKEQELGLLAMTWQEALEEMDIV